MPRFLIDDELSRSCHSVEQARCILNWAKFVGSPRYAQKRHVNLLRLPFPCQLLRELVERGFVDDVRHKHEPLLERRRGFFEDRVKSRLETSSAHGDSTKARFVCRRERRPKRTEAAASYADAVRVNLRSTE